MRWALMGSFEHSNPQLLALYIHRDMIVFVVHKRSLEVPGGSQGRPRGVSGTSPGDLRGVPGVPEGRDLGSQGGPCRSQGRAQGVPGIPGGSGDVPGIPGIRFIMMIP